MNLDLKQKSNGAVISDLKSLVAEERATLTKILHHLREIETRQLYLARGYSSLFAFLTEEIGYSESSAQRRIQAMRLIKDVPEVEHKIQAGKISLSVASQMQSFFRKEDQQRLRQSSPKMKKSEKLKLVHTLQGSSARQCEQKLAKMAPEAVLPKEKTRPLTDEKVFLQLTINKQLLNKIDQLKNLLSHQNPDRSLEYLLEMLVELGLEKYAPERREARRKKRQARVVREKLKPNATAGGESRHPKIESQEKNAYKPLPTSKVPLPTSGVPKVPKVKTQNTRHIPQALRDRVWLRDKGCCQHRDPKTKKICGSRHLIQIDHRYPYSLGGENQLENLRLLCSQHNQFHAKRSLAGKEHLLDPGNPSCS